MRTRTKTTIIHRQARAPSPIRTSKSATLDLRLGPHLAEPYLSGGYWTGVSQENVEEFRRTVTAFNRTVTDGTEDLFETLDEEIEWVPITAFLDGATYRGKDGVREWMDELRRDWEIYELAWEEVRDLGDDRVLAIGRWHAQGRRSGVELRLQEAAWLVRYRNGKLLRMQTFTDRNKALEAVGLSE